MQFVVLSFKAKKQARHSRSGYLSEGRSCQREHCSIAAFEAFKLRTVLAFAVKRLEDSALWTCYCLEELCVEKGFLPTPPDIEDTGCTITEVLKIVTAI